MRPVCSLIYLAGMFQTHYRTFANAAICLTIALLSPLLTRAQVTACGSDEYSVCYHDNMDSVVTYTCNTPGCSMALMFCEGETQFGMDHVRVYDGDSTDAPMLYDGAGEIGGVYVLATTTEPSSLTLQITSDGAASCQGMGYVPLHWAVGCAPVCNMTVGGDGCQDAPPEVLDIGSQRVFTGDNTGATATGDALPGSPLDGSIYVWHAFTTVECADVTISYCGTDPVFGTVQQDLAPTCPAGETLQSASALPTCADGNQQMFYGYLPPGTWYVPVLSTPGAEGPYTITVAAADCLAGVHGALQSAHGWNVFPVPSSGAVDLSSDVDIPEARWELLDAQGRSLKKGRSSFSAGTPVRIAEDGSLAAGPYTVRIEAGGVRSELRIIVR